MKMFIVVALFAIASADQITTLPFLTGDQLIWVHSCRTSTGVDAARVTDLRSGIFTTTDNDDASKNFVLCYLNKNGMFIEGVPQIQVINDKLKENNIHVEENLKTCGIRDDKTYEKEAAYELYKCYMDKIHTSICPI